MALFGLFCMNSSWGGGGWYDATDDLYYFWATELADHCGMHTWTTNSKTVRATCENATGLYKYDGDQIGIWSVEALSFFAQHVLLSPVYIANVVIFDFILKFQHNS